MYKLYYSPGSCSMAVHVALIEVGAKFEIIHAGKPRTKEFLKINPRGAVPVLEVDGILIREGVAILLHLLESQKNDLLPESGKERDATLEWLCFANSTLHPAYSRMFFAHRILGDEAEKNEIYAPTIAAIQKLWNEIEGRLESHQYITGDKITIADILITVIANWSAASKIKINFGKKTKAYFTKVTSRPSYQQALKAEGINYSANL